MPFLSFSRRLYVTTTAATWGFCVMGCSLFRGVEVGGAGRSVRRPRGGEARLDDVGQLGDADVVAPALVDLRAQVAHVLAQLLELREHRRVVRQGLASQARHE